MARRIVDYIFRTAKDDVGPRFKSLERAQRGFKRQSDQVWTGFEKRAKRSLSNVSRHGRKKFRELGRESSNLQGKIVAAFGAFISAAALKKSVENLAEFGDEMTGIAIKLGRPVEELTELRKEIELFSLKSGITDTAAGIARGINLVVGSGRNLENSVEITKKASAVGASQNTATPIIVQALLDLLGSFNLPTSAVDRLLDEMIAGVDAGLIELPQLSQAIGQVGAFAADAKASSAQTIALLEVLSNKGLKAPEAATALAGLFRRIVEPEFAKKARRRGINVFDSKGNLFDVIDILAQVGKKVSQLKNDKRRLELLGELFGGDVRARKALNKTVTDIPLVRDLLEKVGKSSGRAPASVAEGQKRLSADLARVSNATGVLSRKIARPFEPLIDALSDLSVVIAEGTLKEAPPRKPEPFSFAPGGKSLLGLLADPVFESILGFIKETPKGPSGRREVPPFSFSKPPNDFIRDALRGSAGKGNVPQLSFSDQGSPDKKELLEGSLFDRLVNKDLRLKPLDKSIKVDPVEVIIVGEKPNLTFNPKITVNNKIDSATGKTQTEVTISDPVDIQRRLPLGATP